MNALSLTARDIATAILVKPRVSQSVHVSTAVYGGSGLVRALVLVVPEGAETGTYYEVYRQRTIDELKAGSSPEWLELEPYEDEAA